MIKKPPFFFPGPGFLKQTRPKLGQFLKSSFSLLTVVRRTYGIGRDLDLENPIKARARSRQSWESWPIVCLRDIQRALKNKVGMPAPVSADPPSNLIFKILVLFHAQGPPFLRCETYKKTWSNHVFFEIMFCFVPRETGKFSMHKPCFLNPYFLKPCLLSIVTNLSA